MNLNEVIGKEIMEDLKQKGYGNGDDCNLNYSNVVTVGKLLYNILYDAKALLGVDTVPQTQETNCITLVPKNNTKVKAISTGKRGYYAQPEHSMKREIFEGLFSIFGASIEKLTINKMVSFVPKLQNAYYQRKFWKTREAFESDYRSFLNREVYGNKYV